MSSSFRYRIFAVRYRNQAFAHESISPECYLRQVSYSGKRVFNLNRSKGRQKKKYQDQSLITL